MNAEIKEGLAEYRQWMKKEMFWDFSQRAAASRRRQREIDYLRWEECDIECSWNDLGLVVKKYGVRSTYGGLGVETLESSTAKEFRSSNIIRSITKVSTNPQMQHHLLFSFTSELVSQLLTLPLTNEDHRMQLSYLPPSSVYQSQANVLHLRTSSDRASTVSYNFSASACFPAIRKHKYWTRDSLCLRRASYIVRCLSG